MPLKFVKFIAKAFNEFIHVPKLTQKGKQMKSKTVNRIYKMLKPNLKAIIIISILAIIINIGEVIKPYLIKIVIDNYLSFGIWQKGFMTIGIIGSIYIAIVLIR